MKFFAPERVAARGLGERRRHRCRRGRHHRRHRAECARGRLRSSRTVRSCRRCPTCIRTRSSARSRDAPGSVARATKTASGPGARRCTRSSIASTPTRSRRSPRRPTSRWPRPDTRRSPNSITCITTPRASPMPIRRSSHGASSPPRRRPDSGLTLLPVFYAHAGFGGMPTTAGQRRFVHTTYTFTHLYDRCASDPPSTATCWASRRTACARSRRKNWASSCALPGRRADPYPCGRADARSRRLLTRGAACARSSGCSRRRSVDARWCIVHATHMTEREIAALAASGAVAGLAPTTEADLGDGTFPGAALPRGRRTLRRRQRFEHGDFAVRRNCASSNGRSGFARAGATCCAVAGRRTIGTSLWARRRAAAARRRWRSRSGAIAAGQRADLVVLDTTIRRWPNRRAKTSSMRRFSARPACRCAT